MNPSPPETSALQFPCRYPVKAMTRTGGGAADLVLEAVGRHAPGFDRNLVTVRNSRNGRFQSITVVVEAESRAQLEAIYTEISALDTVVMTL